MDESVWTPAQTAKFLGVTERTLEGWRARGTGPAYLKYGKGQGARVRYEPSVVRAYRERCRIECTSTG